MYRSYCTMYSVDHKLDYMQTRVRIHQFESSFLSFRVEFRPKHAYTHRSLTPRHCVLAISKKIHAILVMILTWFKIYFSGKFAEILIEKNFRSWKIFEKSKNRKFWKSKNFRRISIEIFEKSKMRKFQNSKNRKFSIEILRKISIFKIFDFSIFRKFSNFGIFFRSKFLRIFHWIFF